MKDIYIKFDSGIKGDSRDSGHTDQVEATSFSHIVSQPKSATSSSSGGHTAERVEFGDVVFTKDIDTATPSLLAACCAGTLFPTIVVEFYRAYGGTTADGSNKRVMYYKLELRNTIVSSVATVIGAEGLPVETFTLKPSAMSWGYTQHKIDGTSAGAVTKIWNLAGNKNAF